MANWINSFSIGQYRGIKSLVINNLRNINLVVGDNNSGKTSLLEAIYLLRAPFHFDNVVRASRLRNATSAYSPTPYESFINLFPKDIENRNIYVQADGDFGYISLELDGDESVTIIESDDLKAYPQSVRYIKEKTLLGSEIPAFYGIMRTSVNSKRRETPIRFTGISRTIIYNSLRSGGINVVYLSPISHITENTFKSIIKNDDYKEICIELIRLFDPDIEDLIYMPNDLTGRAIEYVKNRILGTVPLSTYGDGIKKVISLANGIVEAAGGILLIDEIDTSIHYRYYSDIFNFLIKASMKFDVQVFITTHSGEAIDGILSTQSYHNKKDDRDDPISLITLRKDDWGNIRSRSMSGFDVQTNRELFDFEVRL